MAKSEGIIKTLSGDVVLNVYTDLPNLPPMLRIMCAADGPKGKEGCYVQMIRGIRRRGESTVDWRCPKCLRVIRLMES